MFKNNTNILNFFFLFGSSISTFNSKFFKNEFYIYLNKKEKLITKVLKLLNFTLVDFVTFDKKINIYNNNISTLLQFYDYNNNIYIYFLTNFLKNITIFNNSIWYFRENFEFFGYKYLSNSLDNRNLLLNYSDKNNYLLKESSLTSFYDYKNFFNKQIKLSKITVNL